MKTMRVWLALIVAAAIMLPGVASAASAEEIDANADVALKAFVEKVDGAQGYLNSAKGVLVFPKVVKAGFIIGGEGGEGALQVGGKTVDYYSTIAGSFGLQAGAVSKSVYILFMTDDALQNFRNSKGWEAGVDGSVTLIDAGAAGKAQTTTAKAPILGFVITNSGLMADISLVGSKYNKIEK